MSTISLLCPRSMAEVLRNGSLDEVRAQSGRYPHTGWRGVGVVAEVLIAVLIGVAVLAAVWASLSVRGRSLRTIELSYDGQLSVALPSIDPYTVSLDAAVRKALGIEVRLGALGIDAPPLRQGRNDIVRVVIGRGPNAEDLIAAFVARSQVPAVEVIDTSAVMFVDLTGRAFRIQRLNPPEGEQLVSDTATWEFDVLPLSAGRQSLTVSASMRVPVPGHGERAVSVPSLEREFTVEVDRLYAGRTFVQRNWQWIGTSVLAAAAVVSGIIWR